MVFISCSIDAIDQPDSGCLVSRLIANKEAGMNVVLNKKHSIYRYIEAKGAVLVCVESVPQNKMANQSNPALNATTTQRYTGKK